MTCTMAVLHRDITRPITVVQGDTAFLNSTQNSPQQRLQGTMWQAVAAEAMAAKPTQVAQETYVSDVVEVVGEPMG